MRGIVSPLHCVSPRTLPEALRFLSEDTLTPLAGATDLFVALNFGTLRERRFLDLSRLGALHRIGMRGDTLCIGAAATFSELIGSRLVRQRLPMLAQAAREVGGIQIQNRGTLGGNVANASPAGDTLPVLAAVDATVVLRSVTGERHVPFTAFYTGYRATVRRPDELIVAFEIRDAGEPARQFFRKVGTRAAQAISKVMLAGVGGPAPRVALGSVGPTVLRLRRTEEALASGAGAEEAAAILETEIAPIDDVRSTAAYRRAVARNLLLQFLRTT